MITAYALSHGKLVRQTLEAGAQLPPGTVWLDLEACAPEEVTAVSHSIRFHLPALRALHQSGQARQNYVEKGVCYLSIPVIIGSQSETPRTGSMLFAVNGPLLVTLRETESRTVHNFITQLQSEPHHLADGPTAFARLLRCFVARLADISETVSHEIERVGLIVFHDSLERSRSPGHGQPNSWRKVLQGLGKTARLNHRLIATLAGLERMVSFVSQPDRHELFGPRQLEIMMLQHEFRALSDQANAMVNEATFLLDAIVGAISIEQNSVIKIFSMVAVVLMPPTMVASIYGMNFAHMPELNWVWGYPAALALMALSGWLPWRWFRRNGWF